MMTEKFNGCTIKVKSGKTRATRGTMVTLVNGQHFPVVEKFDEAKALEEIKRTLAPIHAAPIDGGRWNAHYYAPGTYELCDKEIHPREIGGQCRHFTCQ